MVGTPGGPVPTSVEHRGEHVTISRCWPTVRLVEGLRVFRFEGRDGADQLRAGQLYVDTADDWQVARVKLAEAGQDPKLPELAPALAGDGTTPGELVVHRYGRRAVVRLTDRFAKVVRPGAGPALAAATEGGRRAAQAAGLDAPAVLSAGDSRVDLSVLPGTSLHDSGAHAEAPTWATWWDSWAQRWPQVVAGARDGLSVHGPREEQANLARWVQHVTDTGVLGDLGASLVARAERAYRLLLAEPVGDPATLVLAHRDLHDKQLLGTPDGDLGILDFDTLALAEPALDLANLAVHVDLRAAQGLWLPQRCAVAVEQIERVAAELRVPPVRFEAYAEATRVRLVCLYAFRPRWYPLALRLLCGSDPAG